MAASGLFWPVPGTCDCSYSRVKNSQVIVRHPSCLGLYEGAWIKIQALDLRGHQYFSTGYISGVSSQKLNVAKKTALGTVCVRFETEQVPFVHVNMYDPVSVFSPATQFSSCVLPSPALTVVHSYVKCVLVYCSSYDSCSSPLRCSELKCASTGLCVNVCV